MVAPDVLLALFTTPVEVSVVTPPHTGASWMVAVSPQWPFDGSSTLIWVPRLQYKPPATGWRSPMLVAGADAVAGVGVVDRIAARALAAGAVAVEVALRLVVGAALAESLAAVALAARSSRRARRSARRRR